MPSCAQSQKRDPRPREQIRDRHEGRSDDAEGMFDPVHLQHFDERLPRWSSSSRVDPPPDPLRPHARAKRALRPDSKPRPKAALGPAVSPTYAPEFRRPAEGPARAEPWLRPSPAIPDRRIAPIGRYALRPPDPRDPFRNPRRRDRGIGQPIEPPLLARGIEETPAPARSDTPSACKRRARSSVSTPSGAAIQKLDPPNPPCPATVSPDGGDGFLHHLPPPLERRAASG